MKISQTERTDRVVRKFDVTDGPVLPCPYTARAFRVKRVAITYTSHESGTWGIGGLTHITLTGPVLKKDGTEGKQTYNGWPELDALGDLPHYRWLRDLINRARPYSRAEVFTVNDQEG
jgi:hypothetical protein